MGEADAAPEAPAESEKEESTEGGDEDSAVSNETPVIEEETTPEETPEVTPEEPVEEPVSESAIGIMTVETMAVAVTDCTATAPTGEGFTASLAGTGQDDKLTGADLVLTVTAADGYVVKSVSWAIDGVKQDENTIEAGNNGTYTIKADTLTEKLASAASGVITFAVTTAQTFNVTVTVTGATTNIETLASVVDGEETAIASVQASNTITVESGKALSLKVVPADGFDVTVKVGEIEITGNTNVYVIGAITEAKTVDITTASNTYAVNETIQQNGTAASDASKVATIEYTADCVKDAKIKKGTDLTFKVNEVKDDNGASSFDGKAVEVSYKIGTVEKPLTKGEDGVYKVDKGAITGDVEVIVNVRALEEVTVDFSRVDLEKAELEYKVADAATYTELTAANSSTEVKITEGQTFSFKVEAKDVYQIDKVSVAHGTNAPKVLEKAEEYSFVATKDAPAIIVDTSYDATKVNSLTFKLVGDKDSYTVRPTDITDGEGTAIDDVVAPEAGVFKAGDAVLTQAQEIKVTLTPDDSYEITKVVLGEETLYDVSRDEDKENNPAGPFDISFGESVAAKELTVTTKVKTFENDIKVRFAKGKDPTVVDYEVATGDTVVKDPEADDTYIIKAGEGYLKFDVTTVGKYTPAVTVNGSDKLANPEKAEGKYSYTYLVTKLSDEEDNVITVDAEIATKTVTLVYEAEQVDVSATIGNTLQDATNKVYTVNDGDVLSFKVIANENYQLDKVTKKGAAADAEAEEVTLTNGRFDLTVEEDITITITAKGVLSQKDLLAKTANGTAAVEKDKKGAYVVSNTGTYIGGAVEGSTPVVISDVKLYEKNNEIAATAGEGESAVTNWSASVDKTEITLFPTSAIAGKTLTLKMYRQVTDADGEPTQEEVASYNLAVSANLNAAQVKVSDIKQATDTRAEYSITVNTGAEVGKILLDMTDTDAEVVKKNATAIVDGKLQVTTGFKAGETTIKLYTLKDVNAADTEANRTEIKEVKVTTTALIDIDATKAPKVTLASATDVSITLSLDAKALKLKEPVTGDIYYEIKATANGEIPKNDSGVAKLKNEVIQYVQKNGDQQSTTLWLNVAGAADKSAYGTGGHCKYDVQVRLVHLKDKTDKSAQTTLITDADLAVAEKSVSASYNTGAKPFETKEPYYEDNLKLKKGKTTVYTGETAVVAIPQFGKNTSYMVVDEDYCRDTTKNLNGGELYIDVDPDTNEVSVTAGEYTALGKHTIEVVAISTADITVEDEWGYSESYPTMYASRATVTVTVARGIENLSVSVPSDQLYKDPSPKKAATMTASVTYNSDAKTKKVTWALLNSSNQVLSANDYLNGKLTIKNGKVTLAKDYAVSRNANDNQFKIAAVAADFNRNVDLTPGAVVSNSYDGSVAVSRTITITNDAMTIGSLAILDGENNVIAKDGGTLEASQAQDAKLVAFIPGAPDKAAYTSDDLSTYAAKAENVKFTSGNKAITIAANGTITVNKPAKNVVLTATPGDGNPDKNAKKSMKLTVNYDTTGELGLQITRVDSDDNYLETFSADNKAPEFTDSTVANFALQVQQKNDNGRWEDVAYEENFTNYKLAVKGGKILYNSNDGTAVITTASAVTTITLTNNNVKPAVKTDYVLTNKGISTLATGTKAPKVTLVKGKNTLQAGYYYSEQQIKVQLTNSVKAGNASYIEDFSKLYVKTDFDWTSYNVKKPDAQDEFVYEMNPKGYQRVAKDGSFYLNFQDDEYSTNLTAGSYKVKISFGEIDEDGNFKSIAPAAAAAIKVVKSKAVSFKPVTSYKISATDNGYASLTGKGNYDGVYFSKLQNANIKGKENKFSRYFEIGYNDNYDQVIRLTANYYTDVNDPDINLDFSDKKFKDDLTGYVSYYAYNYGNDDYVEGTVKITMSVTAPAAAITKYTVSTSGVVGTAAGSKVTVFVTDNKKNAVELAGVNYGEGTTWDYAYGGNTIQFTAKAALTAKAKYEIPIVILPADSYYVTEYEKITDTDAKTAFVNKYGVPLTVKVTANDLTTVNKGRIKVDSKQLSQTFTPYYFDGTNYYTYVPFSEVYTGTVIDHITNNSVIVGTGDSQLIKIERDGAYNNFKVTMSKALLEQAIKADVKPDGKTTKGTFYDAKGKAKTLNVKADVCYDAQGIQKDTFTFKLTMPANRSAYVDDEDGGLTAYEKAIDDLNKNKKAIAEKVTVTYDEWNEEWNIYDAQWDLFLEISEAVGEDSGIDFRDAWDGYVENILGLGEMDEPTTTTDGKLPITATLKSYDGSKTSIIVFEIPIPKLETTPDDVTAGVSAFLDENGEKYAVNTVTETEVLTDLRAYMKTWAAEQDPAIDLTPIRFTIDKFTVDPAGFDANGTPKLGSVTGTVVIRNIHTDYAERVEIEDWTIDAPVAKAEVINEVKEALGIATGTGETNDADIIAELVVSNTVEGVKADVLAVAQKAAGFAYTVEYKDNTDASFAFTPVGTAAGSISFTLVVKDSDGEYIGEEKNEDGSIKTPATEIKLDTTPLTANENIMTVAEAEAAVKAWVDKVTGETATDEEKAVLTSATSDSIVGVVKTAAKLKNDDKLNVTVEGFENKPATNNEDGYVKGTVVLTKGGTTNPKEAEVSFELKLPMEWTLANAATKVTTAVANADIYVSNTNVKTDAGKATVAAQILEIAKNAVPNDKFTVAIKQENEADVKLQVKEATVSAAGEVSLELVITEVPAEGGTLGTQNVTVKYAIPQLPEGSGTVEPEVIAITDVLKKAISDAVTDAISDAENPIEIKADTEWSTISEEILAAANGADGVVSNFEVVAGSDPLQIDSESKKATINLVVQQKNLTTNKADITIENIALTEDSDIED